MNDKHGTERTLTNRLLALSIHCSGHGTRLSINDKQRSITNRHNAPQTTPPIAKNPRKNQILHTPQLTVFVTRNIQ